MKTFVRPHLLFAAIVAAMGLGLLASSDSASAVNGAASFTYNGTGTQTTQIFNVFVQVDDNILFNKVKARAKLDVETKATVAAPTDFSLSAPDGNVRQDADLPVTTQNVAKDGGAKEFKLDLTATLTLHVDYDDDDDGNLTCDDYGADDGAGGDACFETSFDVSKNLLNKDMVAPYAGNSQGFSDTTTLFSIPVCSLVFGLNVCSLDLDLTANATLSATAGGAVVNPGFHALRQFKLNGSNLGPSFLLNWPSPGPVVDSFHIPCSAGVGQALSYNLGDNSYDARVTSASVTGTIVLRIDDPIPDIDVFSLSANLIPGGPISVLSSAVDYNQALGSIQAENQPPTITSVNWAPKPGNEGSEITFTAVATDNCDASLEYHWSFSDGGVAFGNNAKHAFADNGNYTGHLSVIDDAGNTAVTDFGPIVINNVSPTVNGGPNMQNDWGRNVAFHANGNDAGGVDVGLLTYTWDFNDPNDPLGAAGQDVVHVYSMPGVSNAVVTVHDKDGATGNDTVQVTITKRDTTLAYTGELQALPMHRINASAQVTDEYGQGAAGVMVTFTLGSGDALQSVSALTNGSGVAATTLLVNQKPPGGFPLAVSAVTNAKYNAPTTVNTTFTVGR